MKIILFVELFLFFALPFRIDAQKGASVSLPEGVEYTSAKGFYVSESVRSGDTIKVITQGADVQGMSRSDRHLSIYSVRHGKILETNLINVSKKSKNGKKKVYFSGKMILTREMQGILYAVSDSSFKGFDIFIQEMDLKGKEQGEPIRLFNFPQRIAISAKVDFLSVSISDDNSKFLIQTNFTGTDLQLQKIAFAVIDGSFKVLSSGTMPIRDGFQPFSFLSSEAKCYVSNSGRPCWLWHEEEKINIGQWENNGARVDSISLQFDVVKAEMVFNSLNEPMVFGFEADRKNYGVMSNEVHISRAFSFKIKDRGEIKVSRASLERTIIKGDAMNETISSEKISDYTWLSDGLYNFDMGRVNNAVHLFNGSTMIFVCSPNAFKENQQMLWFQLDRQGEIKQANLLTFKAVSDETASLMAVQRQNYFFSDDTVITYIQTSRDLSQRIFDFSVESGSCQLIRQGTIDPWGGDERRLNSDIVFSEDKRCYILFGNEEKPEVGVVAIDPN